MIEILINFFKKPAEVTIGKTPDDLCANCWGEQEYDSKIRTMYIDRQIDVNNNEANYTFIKDFVIKHIDGIRLKRGNNSSECPMCRLKITYD